MNSNNRQSKYDSYINKMMNEVKYSNNNKAYDYRLPNISKSVDQLHKKNDSYSNPKKIDPYFCEFIFYRLKF